MSDAMKNAAEAILFDIRGRRLLKWLFAEDADSNPHPIGYVDSPIALKTQMECVTTWVKIVVARTSIDPIAETHRFTVGPLTMKRVFEAANLTNLSDMQAVLDAVERALTDTDREAHS